MAEVTLKNVTKVYEGGQIAAKDININVNDKEFVVLVGPSG
jgi:multiple sugar transport system ATP-binding protein